MGFTSKLTKNEQHTTGDYSKLEEYVNILTDPRIVDLDSSSEITVSKVSCGSRHTAAVTGKNAFLGVMYFYFQNIFKINYYNYLYF